MSLSIYLSAPFTMRRLRRSRRLKAAELKKLQNGKLRAIVKHGYDNVPYYHGILEKAKIRPNDIKTVDDLHRIPITEKEDIRDLPLDKITAKNIDLSQCYNLKTSGSTGTPMSLYWDWKARSINLLLQFAWQLDCGDRMTNKQVVIGANWYPSRHPFQRIGIFRAKRLSPFDDTRKQIEQIKKFGARTLITYPSVVRVIAKEYMEAELGGLDVGLIFTAGELIDDHTRKLANDVFQAELFDKYGAHEVGSISTECRQRTGYHILSDFVLVETLRDGESLSPGDEGELTVTNLENLAMPFIRYNLKDLGTLVSDACSCGNLFPLMRVTGGRKSDIVQLPDGRITSALPVYSKLVPIQGIRQFQIIQEKMNHFTVKILKSRRFTEGTAGEIKRTLKNVLGDVEIDVLVVEDLPREESGKFKQFISKVK